jgi:hypothetical protein
MDPWPCPREDWGMHKGNGKPRRNGFPGAADPAGQAAIDLGESALRGSPAGRCSKRSRRRTGLPGGRSSSERGGSSHSQLDLARLMFYVCSHCRDARRGSRLVGGLSRGERPEAEGSNGRAPTGCGRDSCGGRPPRISRRAELALVASAENPPLNPGYGACRRIRVM